MIDRTAPGFAVDGENLLQLFNLRLAESVSLVQTEIRHGVGPRIGQLHIALVATVRVRMSLDDDLGDIVPELILQQHIQIHRDDIFQYLLTVCGQRCAVITEKHIRGKRNGTRLGIHLHRGIAERRLQRADDIRPDTDDILQLLFGRRQLLPGIFYFQISVI